MFKNILLDRSINNKVNLTLSKLFKMNQDFKNNLEKTKFMK
jgi:hypothetical protein